MADEKSTEYVTLVSTDGYEFKILRSAACIAGTIKKALDPLCMYRTSFTTTSLTAHIAGFRENTQNRIDLPTIKYELPALSRIALLHTDATI
jgi:transcription elongation factor B subunit 1